MVFLCPIDGYNSLNSHDQSSMKNFVGIDQNITELWLKEHVPQNKPLTSPKVNFF